MRISDWSSDVCSSDLCLTPLDAVGPGASVVPKGVDELALVHLRPTLDADLARPVEQLVLGAVLVVLGLATALAHLAAPLVVRGVRDPSGLLLAHPVVPQGLVLPGLLDRRSVVLPCPRSE